MSLCDLYEKIYLLEKCIFTKVLYIYYTYYLITVSLLDTSHRKSIFIDNKVH